MRRVLIFDLQFMNYVYHSTPRPSMYTMLVSGYHKAKGDKVIFTDRVPEFGTYDLVYINKDERGLFHQPAWLAYGNVRPIGGHWGGVKAYYNPEWEEYPPDLTIYRTWVENWLSRYKKYNPRRLDSFFRTPVKISQNGRKVQVEGKHLLIIDDDIHEWENGYEYLEGMNVKWTELLYPLKIDPYKSEEVFEFVYSTRNQYLRDSLWGEFETVPIDQIDLIAEAWNKFRIGRVFRLKVIAEASLNSEWREIIESAIHFAGKMRERCGKRIIIYPYNMESFKYPRVLQEMKRWSGVRVGYNKNTLLDYILVDGCRNTEDIMDFLEDPYEYLENNRQGSNKLYVIPEIIENDPWLLLLISEPYFGAAS